MQGQLGIVAVVAIVVIGLLFMTGTLDPILGNIGIPTSDTIIQLPAAQQPPIIQEQNVDLRELFQDFSNLFPNASVICTAGGGTVHWEADWIGCDGVGPAAASCLTAGAQAIGNQCQAVGATWVCNPGGVYCKY